MYHTFRVYYYSQQHHSLISQHHHNSLSLKMVAHSVSNIKCNRVYLRVLLQMLIVLFSIFHQMGNSVFRYFLKWLRVQMRKEAYKRCVQQAEQSSTTQTGASGGAFWRRGALSNRFININKPGEVEDKSEDNDDNTPEAIHDEDVNSATKQENGQNIHDNNEDKRPNGRKFPQLYEIAKVEGDKEWLEWLQAHIWTYVGLAAPLLGSPGPLRSVLSGENMGLPFSDEEARELELCKSYFFVVCSCLVYIFPDTKSMPSKNILVYLYLSLIIIVHSIL